MCRIYRVALNGRVRLVAQAATSHWLDEKSLRVGCAEIATLSFDDGAGSTLPAMRPVNGAPTRQ